MAQQPSVFTLVRVLDRGLLTTPDHAVPRSLDGPLKVSQPSCPHEILDGRLLISEVHIRVQHTGHLLERLLDAAGATRAGHLRDTEGGLSHLRAVPSILYGPDKPF